MDIRTSPRRWWALLSLVPAVLAVGLDGTILSVALPTLGRELDAGTGQLQWFLTGYTLAFAAAMIPAGSLGDRFGRKRVLLVALAVFALGSAMCALAPGSGMFIAARIVLGLGAAAILPMALAAIPFLFDEHERGRAVGVMMSVTMLGFPLGPVLGGWLLTHAWWGWVFLINIPVVAIAVIAVAAPDARVSRLSGRAHRPGRRLALGGRSRGAQLRGDRGRRPRLDRPPGPDADDDGRGPGCALRRLAASRTRARWSTSACSPRATSPAGPRSPRWCRS